MSPRSLGGHLVRHGQAIGLAVAVGIAYFLVARLSLALRTEAGTSAFWPAAGIAIAAAIVFGNARWAISASIAIASIASSLMIGRSPWLAIAFGVANAGQVLLAGYLIERWFKGPFAFRDVHHVLGFVAAAGLGAAVCGAGGGAAVALMNPTASFWEAWRAWFLSGAVGAVVVAPFLIGLAQLWRERQSKGEWTEGLGVLALLVLTSLYAVTQPPGSWVSFSPGAIELPFLFWLTARGQPAFGIVGAFIAAAGILLGTIFGVGHFGDASIAATERIMGAQAAMTAVTLYTLVLTALFTERRRSEAALKHSNDRLGIALETEAEGNARLADALAAGEVIAFEWDAVTRQSRRSANAALILGYEESSSSPTASFLQRVHPDDRRHFRACVRDLRPDKPSYTLSFRSCSPDGGQLWLEETARGEFDAGGRLLRIKGLTRNVTDRKNAERALVDRDVQLSLAGKAALVGSFTLDFETEEVQISEGYAAIHDLPEGTGHTTRRIWKAGLHPEDFRRVDELRDRVLRDRKREHGMEYRIVRSTGEVRWIETRCFISYGSDGRPRRAVGVDIDVTARKRAEEQQRMLVAELDHRVKNVLATVSAIASRTQDSSLSSADFGAKLAGRIQSMAATHELLSRQEWNGISVRALVQRELAPYTSNDNADLDGPDLTLSPDAAQVVSMVLHELATNAAKYGALSTDDGRVSVQWNRAQHGNACLGIEWQERGGPAVQPPQRSGYGAEIIRNLVPYELGGSVDLVFASEGLRCAISIPLTKVSSNDGDGNRGSSGSRAAQADDRLPAGSAFSPASWMQT